MPIPDTRRHLARLRVPAAAVALSVALVAPYAVAAAGQDGTPVVPGADLCTVAPLTAPVWDGVEVPEPTAPVSTDGPFQPPAGDPVDAATAEAVTGTITQAIACQNAGEIGRLLALYSEYGLRALFSGSRGQPADEVDAIVGAGATPVAADREVGLVTVEDIVSLDDGRVAATVTTEASGITYVDVVFLAPNESGDGRPAWLLDDSVAVDSQTQVEGGVTEIP
jgi:hypothetical protein